MVTDGFVVLMPTETDFGKAKHYLARHTAGLRAGDALHLAIAFNNMAEAIFTLDKTLLAVGTALGLPMSAGIQE